MSVCLLYVCSQTTFFWKVLETCGFLQMLRLLSEQVFKEKFCPSGHFSGRKLAGTGPYWSKNEKNGQKWAGNGPKTGGDGHVSLQTGGKHERACFGSINMPDILTGMPLVLYILIK